MVFQSVTTLPAWSVPQARTNSDSKCPLLIFIFRFLLESCREDISSGPPCEKRARKPSRGRDIFHDILNPPWEQTVKALIRRSFSSHGRVAMGPRSTGLRLVFTRNFIGLP